jgi:hypothetical protein
LAHTRNMHKEKWARFGHGKKCMKCDEYWSPVQNSLKM